MKLPLVDSPHPAFGHPLPPSRGKGQPGLLLACGEKVREARMRGFSRTSTLVALAMTTSFTFIALTYEAAEHAPSAAPPPLVVDSLKKLPGGLAPLPPPPTVQPDRVSLGRALFFDNALSADRSMSCATCHDPKHAFTDGKRLAEGFGGKTLRRHSPTVLNAVFTEPQFWDGRATGLAAQATGPIMSRDEMNMASEEMVIGRLEASEEYARRFRETYGAKPTLELVGQAIAAFESTLVTPDSPFDRYVAGDKSALDEQQKRGLALFIGKAACTQCHLGANFTDGSFHNVGIAGSDAGRYEVTKKEEDRGAFKTPTLRNVALTAPYMHDGSVATLEEVVKLYNIGGGPGAGKSDRIFELGLTDDEVRDLVAFLHSLTGTIPQ